MLMRGLAGSILLFLVASVLVLFVNGLVGYLWDLMRYGKATFDWLHTLILAVGLGLVVSVGLQIVEGMWAHSGE